MVIDALNNGVEVNYIAAMSSYGIDLQHQILQAEQKDDRCQ